MKPYIHSSISPEIVAVIAAAIVHDENKAGGPPASQVHQTRTPVLQHMEQRMQILTPRQLNYSSLIFRLGGTICEEATDKD
jgi:hypothetical protein